MLFALTHLSRPPSLSGVFRKGRGEGHIDIPVIFQALSNSGYTSEGFRRVQLVLLPIVRFRRRRISTLLYGCRTFHNPVTVIGIVWKAIKWGEGCKRWRGEVLESHFLSSFLGPRVPDWATRVTVLPENVKRLLRRAFKNYTKKYGKRFIIAPTHYARRYLSNGMIHVQQSFRESVRALNKFWSVESWFLDTRSSSSRYIALVERFSTIRIQDTNVS